MGTLTGRVVLVGDIPQLPDLKVTRDQKAFRRNAVPDESWKVNPTNRGVANVVVFLKTKGQIPIHPDYRRTASKKVELRMERGQYKPHVVLLRTSQTFVHRSVDDVNYQPRMDVFKNMPQ